MSTPLRAEFPEHRRPELRSEFLRNRERFLRLVNETVILRALAGLPLNGTTRNALLAELSTVATPEASPQHAA